jgi:regulator of RNase E activity RraA
MANLHLSLGCVGAITNGAMRDIPGIPNGFPILASAEKPSHGFLHTVGFGEAIEVAGMAVGDGNLVHMDRNGAIVVPHALAAGLPEAANRVIEKEQRVIVACRATDFDLESVKTVMMGR